MKFKKYLAKGLVLGMIVSNLHVYSFASSLENKYYNELSSIETKEDLQKSAQRAVRAGEVDTWITGLASMPTARGDLTSAVVDGKIYCIGGALSTSVFTNKVEVYDPATNTWETKADMPTNGSSLTSTVIDGKIYCIGGQVVLGGYKKNVYMYDPKTDKWETKADMPTARGTLISEVINGKIYCIGGHNGSVFLDTVEVYDPVTDTWETKTNMPTALGYLASEVVDGKIYCIGGRYNGYQSYSKSTMVYDPATDKWEYKASMSTARYALTSSMVNGKIYCIGGYESNTIEAYIAETLEQKAESSVSNAELTKDPIDIETARALVNQLPEGQLKTQLQTRLDAISSNLSLERKNATSNLDLYIKCENMLVMSLNTNSITFDDFSGVTDMEKANAVNITVTSSLPYQLNAYLPVEIQSPDKLNTMDKTILNIKENSELTYQTFANTVDKIVLKDNCIAGNDINHEIDIKLKGGIAHEKDVYKTTIKFEAQQK